MHPVGQPAALTAVTSIQRPLMEGVCLVAELRTTTRTIWVRTDTIGLNILY